MPKYLIVDRAEGQATSAPNASATSITLTSSADTSEFTENGSPSATNPLPCLLTDQPYGTAPSKIETVLVTDITGDVFTINRDADGKGAQDFSAGTCYIGYYDTAFLLQNMVQRSGDTVHSVGNEMFDNANTAGTVGVFDYNEGQYQKLTLTSAGVAIDATNVPAGAMLTIELGDGSTYAPDFTAQTGLWSEDTEPTLAAKNILHAVGLSGGAVRWIAGRRWSS